MNRLLGAGVSSQILQHIVDGILKASTGFVSGFNAFGNKLANFKSVHSLREGTMNLVGTHDGTPVNLVGGA